MDRETLYRGKRTDNGEWVYGSHLFDEVTGKHYIVLNRNITENYTAISSDGEFKRLHCTGIEVIPETVGQYTGKTAKNGKKIFEEDIITNYINWLGGRVNGVVRYESKTASWACDFILDNKKESGFLADWVYGNGAKVIGNVYDNPELLEVK